MHDGGREAQRTAARHARRGLDPIERRRAAEAIARHLATTAWLRPGTHVAAFASIGDELDSKPVLQLLVARGCEILLPRITNHRARRMTFSAVGAPLRTNRYGIAEPTGTDHRDARWCDLVLLPLVAFDACGHRLGTGGGYYDRALAFRRLRQSWPGPRLVGLAHSAQELPTISPNPTDVALDAIVTERGIRIFGRHRT